MKKLLRYNLDVCDRHRGRELVSIICRACVLVGFVTGLLTVSHSSASAASDNPSYLVWTDIQLADHNSKWLNSECDYASNRLIYCGKENVDEVVAPYEFGPNSAKQVFDMSEDRKCVAFDDGSVMCRGDNDSAQLGDGTTRDSARFVSVALPSVPGDSRPKKLIADSGRDYRCLLRVDQKLICWGSNHNGMLVPGGPELILPSQIDPAIFGIKSFGAVVNLRNSASLNIPCASDLLNNVGCRQDHSVQNATFRVNTSAITTPDVITKLYSSSSSVWALGAGLCATTQSGRVYCTGLVEDLSTDLGENDYSYALPWVYNPYGYSPTTSILREVVLGPSIREVLYDDETFCGISTTGVICKGKGYPRKTGLGAFGYPWVELKYDPSNNENNVTVSQFLGWNGPCGGFLAVGNGISLNLQELQDAKTSPSWRIQPDGLVCNYDRNKSEPSSTLVSVENDDDWGAYETAFSVKQSGNVYCLQDLYYFNYGWASDREVASRMTSFEDGSRNIEFKFYVSPKSLVPMQKPKSVWILHPNGIKKGKKICLTKNQYLRVVVRKLSNPVWGYEGNLGGVVGYQFQFGSTPW